MLDLRRRQFLTLLSGAAAAWPLGARAQQADRMRRIGVLMGTANDREGRARYAAFLQGLTQLGWSEGRNVQIDTHWGTGDASFFRPHITELLALAPDVILASGTSSMGPLHQATLTRCPSSSSASSVRSAAASSRAFHGRAATPPASSCSSTASALNGWSCSNRSHRA